MNVVKKTVDRNIDQVNPGELFIILDDIATYGVSNSLFMKIDNQESEWNSVSIDNGKLCSVNRNMILQIVNGELVI